jgi:chorismate dehydratase
LSLIHEMDKVTKIVAVNYSNTFPFVYGIEKSGLISDYILQLLHPVACAESFISGYADIALLPVGALDRLPEHKIITDLCIGAVQQVKSVLLVSHKPLHKINNIGLDTESATSVRLCKVLAANYWNISPKFQPLQVIDHTEFPEMDAFVVIGDKAFGLAPHFGYVYDLAEEWYKFTAMPFVFAVWVSQSQVNDSFIEHLNNALHYGVTHIPEVVDHFRKQFRGNFDLKYYLTKSIDYRFDEMKKKSVEKFLGYARLIK